MSWPPVDRHNQTAAMGSHWMSLRPPTRTNASATQKRMTGKATIRLAPPPTYSENTSVTAPIPTTSWEAVNPNRTPRRLRREHRTEEHTSELQSLMRNSYAIL